MAADFFIFPAEVLAKEAGKHVVGEGMFISFL